MSENGQDPVLVEKPGQCTNDECTKEENEDPEHDPHYEPIITLPEIEVPTLEEEETILLNLRAKLYRFDGNENPPEWKERGTGTVKILHHRSNETVRVVMRRDKTLKLCANHFITPYMELKPNASCERAWVYSVKADFADETEKSELLAIKFANVENAQKWKDVFESAKELVDNNSSSKLNDTLEDEKETKSDNDTLPLNDTLEDDKKNSSFYKKDGEDSDTPKKQANSEVTEKLSSLTIEETKESESS